MRTALSAYARGATILFGLEQMAPDTASVPKPRRRMLGILLNATLPMTRHGRPILRSVWANEAMNRAYYMIRLTAALERLVPLYRFDLMADEEECRIATEIATVFRSLDVDDDDQMVPCSEDLRIAVRGLTELFAPVAGPASFRANIERLSLPGFKRRALILAACELVSEVLLRGFLQSSPCDIIVALCKPGPTDMRLTVSGGACCTTYDRPSDNLFDLAALLECNLSYCPLHTGGVAAELTFRIGACDCRVK